jgi:hypothetical protein
MKADRGFPSSDALHFEFLDFSFRETKQLPEYIFVVLPERWRGHTDVRRRA